MPDTVTNIKKLLLTLLAGLTACICLSQKPAFHTDLFFDHLGGPVQSVRTVPYTLNKEGQKAAPDSCCVTLLEYDSNGFRTKELSQDPVTNQMNGQVYTKRFPNGHAKEIEFRMNGKLISTLVSTLDEKGRYNKAKNFDSAGKLVSHYADVKVNEFGKVVFLNEFGADSSLQRTIVNRYENHIWIGGSIQDGQGKVIYSISLKLDKAKNPIEMVETHWQDSLASVTTTRYKYDRYDKNGNWIERRELDKEGRVTKIVQREIVYFEGE